MYLKEGFNKGDSVYVTTSNHGWLQKGQKVTVFNGFIDDDIQLTVSDGTGILNICYSDIESVAEHRKRKIKNILSGT
jgi:hypothetical protein